MSRRPLFWVLALRSYVQPHPIDEWPSGPDHQICRRCGKCRDVPFSAVPPGLLITGDAFLAVDLASASGLLTTGETLSR